jgi:hypothetical protein
MKKIMFILTVTIFVVGCSENNIKNQKFLGAKGNPKSIKETKYEAVEKFGEVIEGVVDEVIRYEFDKSGNIQKLTHYDDDGDVVFSISYVFEDGECIETKSYQKYNNIVSTSSLKNRTSKNETWERKTSDGKITTSYSEYDKLTRTTITKDSENIIVSKEEQIIDNKGNLVEIKVYNEEKVVYWYKSKFDDNSQEIERKMLVGYDEGIFTYKYDSFDKKGNWIKRVEYKDGKIESLTIREIEY